MNVKKILYISLIVILLAIFGFSAFYVGSYFWESEQQKSEFEDLAAMVDNARATAPTDEDPDSTTPDGTEDPTDGTAAPSILPEYAALYAMNDDMVGWIQIEDTEINYPVMQTPDSVDYYLHTNFKHVYSAQGCIYVREQCDVNRPSDNLTIYGHNMRDGSMFNSLLDYQKESFWKEHDTIIFDTLTEHHTYKIFAVFKTTASVGKGFSYHQFVDALDEAEFDEYVETCKSLAFYDTGITPEYGDKLITLSTCEYSQTNGRFVVVAVRED